jgi:hypothetical protein
MRLKELRDMFPDSDKVSIFKANEMFWFSFAIRRHRRDFLLGYDFNNQGILIIDGGILTSIRIFIF